MSDLPVSISDRISHSPRKVILGGLTIVIFFLGGFILWSLLAPLGAAVHAPADITFDTKRKTVQNLEGGIVKQILVREGEVVQVGQPLILLEDDQIKPIVNLLGIQTLAETASIARLEAEKNDQSVISFPPVIRSRANEPAVAYVIQTETRLFNAKRQAYQSQVEVLQSQILQTRKLNEGLQKQILEKKKEIDAVTEQLAANKDLLKDGYVTRMKVLELEQMLAAKIGECESAKAQMAGNKERLEEFAARLASLKSARIQDAVTEMKQSIAKRVELEERVRPIRNTLERQIIRAPVSGTVVDLKVTTVGGVIAAREPLMDIVPVSDHLILLARIGVNDINDVQIGLPAEVILTAYKASSTPQVRATVSYVSADRLTTRTMQGELPYYEVRLQIDPESLKKAGNLHLYPGMAAQVSISTRPRTAFDYFIGPIKDRMRKAFSEK